MRWNLGIPPVSHHHNLTHPPTLANNLNSRAHIPIKINTFYTHFTDAFVTPKMVNEFSVGIGGEMKQKIT